MTYKYKTSGTQEYFQVTENTDRTAPILLTAVIPSNGQSIVLTYDGTLEAGANPAWNAYYTIYGTSSTVSSVTVSGNTITVAVGTSIFQGETVTLDYTAGTFPITDEYLNSVADLSSQAVTNNSTVTP